MRRLLVCMWAVIALCGVVAVGRAAAHPLPKGTSIHIGLHRICSAVGVCKDKAPRPYEPEMPCNTATDGQIRIVYDPRLGADVEWECRCPLMECKWYRLRIVKSSYWPFWVQQERHAVLDWTRACPQLGCRKVLRVHWYPAIFYYPHKEAQHG